MRSSVVTLIVAFLAGSAVTAIILPWERHEPVSNSASFQGTENTDVDIRLVRIQERLINIEALLAQAQKASSSKQVTINDVVKSGENAVGGNTRSSFVNTANTIVGRVLQSGVITPSDLNAFAAAADGLHKEEREKMLSQLMTAINNDQLRVQLN